MEEAAKACAGKAAGGIDDDDAGEQLCRKRGKGPSSLGVRGLRQLRRLRQQVEEALELLDAHESHGVERRLPGQRGARALPQRQQPLLAHLG